MKYCFQYFQFRKPRKSIAIKGSASKARVLCAILFVTFVFAISAPANAFWFGQKAKQQREAVLGVWKCYLIGDSGGKLPGTHRLKLQRKGDLLWVHEYRSTTPQGNKVFLRTISSSQWSIPRENIISIGGKGSKAEYENLSTPDEYFGAEDLQEFRQRVNEIYSHPTETEIYSGINEYEIMELNSTRFRFQAEGGGDATHCERY